MRKDISYYNEKYNEVISGFVTQEKTNEKYKLTIFYHAVKYTYTADNMGEIEKFLQKETTRIIEVRGKMSKEVGIKQSNGKTRWSLLPFKALEHVVRVLNFGATTKYSMDNWKNVTNKAPYLDAVVRHWEKYEEGEELDTECKENHLACIICNCLFLLHDRDEKKDIPFDEYLRDLKTYDDYVKDLNPNKFDVQDPDEYLYKEL